MMNNVREKLEILRHKLAEMISAAVEPCDEGECCESCKYFHSTACTDYLIADYLIDNGVTVQEWIPVTESLPEEGGLYITFGCTAVPVRWLHNFDKDIGKFGSWWNYEPDGKEHPRYRFIEAGNISHWAPLPTPPKQEG